MKLGQSIEDYEEEVISYINDNDNVCIMIAWVLVDCMEEIYEAQIMTVSPDMFDFSGIDSSKAGTQDGYFFVEDYNGNTVTITFAVKVS